MKRQKELEKDDFKIKKKLFKLVFQRGSEPFGSSGMNHVALTAGQHANGSSIVKYLGH